MSTPTAPNRNGPGVTSLRLRRTLAACVADLETLGGEPVAGYPLVSITSADYDGYTGERHWVDLIRLIRPNDQAFRRR